MKQQKEVKISGWAAHLTTGVSVTLALLTLGLIALIWIAAASETRRMMEKIEISVVIADSIGEDRAKAVCSHIESRPFSIHPVYISGQQALENWKSATGEDLERVFGVNPLSAEISFSLNSAWSSPDSIESVKKYLMTIPEIAEIGMPDRQLVETMNSNIRKITVGFSAVALVMLIISFVLISNTVRLSIYSKRFTIHTMQLVGATDAFIRRPFMIQNAVVGIVSGVLAAGLLSAMLALCPKMGFPELPELIGWRLVGLIGVGLVVSGALICTAAAAVATTRHLRQDYEDLFK